MTKLQQSVKSKIMKNKGKTRASHLSEGSEGEIEFVESLCKLICNLILGPLLSY